MCAHAGSTTTKTTSLQPEAHAEVGSWTSVCPAVQGQEAGQVSATAQWGSRAPGCGHTTAVQVHGFFCQQGMLHRSKLFQRFDKKLDAAVVTSDLHEAVSHTHPSIVPVQLNAAQRPLCGFSRVWQR